ncbi:MAG: winged helix-turn-helix transcriptional regulator [Verrucomicrobia bacterium]|nr:winged helix-turn-helix transcriptional regulator [Verrucomicrobiota bacterium]
MLYAIPNLASSRTKECTPWNTTTLAPPRIRWNHPEIEHVFYSGFEGLVSSIHVDSKNNPVIGAFFREIDRADEVGSGMRNLMLYGKNYGGADPQLIEGDIFQMVISVPEFGESPAEAPKQVSEKGSEKILRLMRESPSMSAAEVAKAVGISPRAVEKQIASLKGKGQLRRVGPAKGGHWEVVDSEIP